MSRWNPLYLCLVFLLTACAGMQERETLQTERTLSAAGFQMRLADTPERLTQLQALPQRQLIVRQSEGNPYYVYADAQDCKCISVGTEKAYQRFEKMTIDQNIAAEEATAWEAAPAFDMGFWGPWGPWWY